MSLRSWIRSSFSRRATSTIRRAPRARLGVQLLEDRCVPSTIVVDNPADTPVSGKTSLRQAIAQATTSNGDDTITFLPSAFNNFNALVTITLNGQLDLSNAPGVNGALAIQGPAANLLSISGNNASRVFMLDGSSSSATLSGLTVTRGQAPTGGGIQVGNRATLTMTGCAVNANAAQDGGGLYVQEATVTLTNCTISRNSASSSGGAGGLFHRPLTPFRGEPTSLVTLTNCTISNNTNGGLANLSPGSNSGDVDAMVLRNCTVSANTNFGLLLADFAETTTVGETQFRFMKPDVTLTNTVIAGNDVDYTRDIVGGFEVLGDINNTRRAWTPFSPRSNFNFIGGFPGTQAELNTLLLAPLGNYGGPTETMPPLPGSRVRNRGGSGPGILTTDQRGLGRVGNVDIGAVESQGYTLTPAPGGSPQTALRNTVFAKPLTVSVTANNPLEPVNGGLITFSGPGTGAHAVLSGGSVGISGFGNRFTEVEITGGSASATATANNTLGTYTVNATAYRTIFPDPASSDQAIPFNLANITNAALTSIAVTPSNPSVTKGVAQQFTATATFADGATGNFSSSVTWTSSTPAVATISSSGSALGVGAGTSAITASLGAITSSATTLTVTPPTLFSFVVTLSNPNVVLGLTRQLTATGNYSDGSTQDLTSSVTWTSASPEVATINSAGLAQSVALGTSEITAALPGFPSIVTTLTVTPGVLSSIAVTPSAPTVANGINPLFTATGTYTDGSTQNITSSVTWASQTTSVATINFLGLADTNAVGTTVITATRDGITSPGVTLTVAPPVASIAVTPASASVAQGRTQQFTATATLEDSSTQDITSYVTWISATPEVATIGAGGLATAGAIGTAQIRAVLNLVSSPGATLEVTNPALISIVVSPSSPTVANGLTQQFTATGTYTDGSTPDLTSSVTWASATPAVATIDSAGLASTLTAGSSVITAALDGVTSSDVILTVAPTLVSIAVTPDSPIVRRGETRQFTATGTFEDASTRDITSAVTWVSADTFVAVIDSGGLATALNQGTSVIKASLQGVTSPDVTLRVAGLLSIAVTPSSPSVALGLTQLFTAIGSYNNGATQDITSSVTWVSATPAVATISDTGLASTLAMGTSVITASMGGVTSPDSTLTVTAAELTSIAVTPSNRSVAKGLTQQLTATGIYTDGATQDLTSSVTWVSATQGVATISGTGLASTHAVGTSVITASLGAITSPDDTLTVIAATLTSIAVTPGNPSVAKGRTQQFSATGTYTDGSTQDVTNSVTWVSAMPAAATISSTGLASTLAVGTSAINASLSGKTSPDSTLTVTAAELTQIAVTPGQPSVVLGLTQQFTATGTYTDGSTQNLTSSATWVSATPAVATISSTGLAAPLALGISLITAALDGVTSSSVNLNVTPASIAVYRPGTQTFYLDRNGNGRWDGPDVDTSFHFGLAGDVPIAGDWSGSGTSKIGVYRPSNQTFYLDRNGNGQWDGPSIDRQYRFGTLGDTPLAGDWDGDGTFEIGIYRPSKRAFCLDLNGNGQWDSSTDAQYYFGTAGDVPIVGDWDGDGKSEIGIYRPSTRAFCLDLNGNGQWDALADGVHYFGSAGDTPLVTTWRAGARSRIGIFRSSTRTYCLDINGDYQWDGATIDALFGFGLASDRPLAGYWA